MSARNILMAAGGSADDKLYVDDVFSAYTYTGNSSTQTINNGIDLAGKGGLVWIKGRSGAYTHSLYDTARGAPNRLSSETTGAQISDAASLTSFSSNGFALGAISNVNQTLQTFVSWTFRKAPKFFDVVTWTGNGANPGSQTIAHSLGVIPGMVICKKTSSTSNWFTFHRSLAAKTDYLFLNMSSAATTNGGGQIWDATATDFTVYAGAGMNDSGATYVAYLFAHDPSADGFIQCGSFTTDGSGNATVNLGWEPQYLMVKASSTTGNWAIVDAQRGLTVGGVDARLFADLTNAEASSTDVCSPSATGFNTFLGASSTYIYLAIRRPNKPPTTGTQVYNAIARTGTGAAATVTGVGFAPDAVLFNERVTGTDRSLLARLIGNFGLRTSSNIAEGSFSAIFSSFDMDGISVLGNSILTNTSGGSYINHFFKRAHGFFDVVCYTGTGVARTIPHNLGAVPELMIVKCRSTEMLWGVYSAPTGNTQYMVLSATNVPNGSNDLWNNTTPTASVFSVSTSIFTNTSAENYVAYLFASLPSISKVGTYTGNGSSQNIDCGFATGARFVLIKRTDASGAWWVFDSVRGITAGNDPVLALNSATAEYTVFDEIDPYAGGFNVSYTGPNLNINVTSATYIYLAIA